MVTAARRDGASRLGCLLGLVLAVAVAYLSFNVGPIYYKYHRYRDAMRQEARFAERRTDSAIVQRLTAFADSLELPPEARDVHIRRTLNSTEIWAEYTEVVDLRFFARELHLRPRAEQAH